MTDGEGGFSFEVLEQDLAGRAGRLRTRGRTVSTPALMPVVNPNLMEAPDAITPQELSDTFGFEMVITNSYIIRRSDRLREWALSEGLRSLLGFDGVVMTDSGTVQSYIYGSGSDTEVDVDPLEIVELQRDMGSDIGTILDRFTTPDTPRAQAERELATTLERARASMEVNGEMELAVPVQGGTDLGLRRASAEAVREMGAKYVPIGGVVPLLESYRYPELVDIICTSKQALGGALPVHLFGAGHPMFMPLAAALGCDLFDSASYAKFASDGRYMTRSRTLHIEEMQDLPCPCPVCSRTDAADLRSLPPALRTNAISRHNLWVLRTELVSIRSAIAEGTLWELVEGMAASNPRMHLAVRGLLKWRGYLATAAPRSSRRFMCSTDLSLARPEFERFCKEMAPSFGPIPGRNDLVLGDHTGAHRPDIVSALRAVYSTDRRVIVRTPLGPVPYEVFEMYPFSQMVTAPEDGLPPGLAAHMLEANAAIEGLPVLDEVAAGMETGTQDGLDTLRVAMIARVQFGMSGGRYADEMLFGTWKDPADLPTRMSLVVSKRTGKLRNVHLRSPEGPGVHVLSLRAEDGLFSLKWEGAVRLHAGSGPDRWRVIVEDDTAPFNGRGLNVFNKFVAGADPRIRSGDEVMVTDTQGVLYAVGRAVIDGPTMVQARAGIAVKVREGREKSLAEAPPSF